MKETAIINMKGETTTISGENVSAKVEEYMANVGMKYTAYEIGNDAWLYEVNWVAWEKTTQEKG